MDLQAAAARALLPHRNMHERNKQYDWSIPSCELTAAGTLTTAAIAPMLLVSTAVTFRAAIAKALPCCDTLAVVAALQKAAEGALAQKATAGNSPPAVSPLPLAPVGAQPLVLGTPALGAMHPPPPPFPSWPGCNRC